MVESSQGTSERQEGTGNPRISGRIAPRFTIAVRLISFVVLLALLAGGTIGFVTISTSRDYLHQIILNNNLAQAQLAAEFASNYMEVIQASVRSFAARPTIIQAVLDNEPGRVQPELTSFVQIQMVLSSVGIYDIKGIQKVFNDVSVTTIGQSFADREWFQQIVATKKPYQGIPIKSRSTGESVSPYAIPILDEQGQVRAVVTGSISLAKLSTAIVNIDCGPDTRITLIDLRNGGLILADSDPQRILSQVSEKSEVVSRVLARDRGAIETTSSTGEQYLSGFAPVSGFPWSVLVITPSEKALAIVQTLIQDSIIYIGFITLVAAIVGAVLMLWVTRPLKRLIAGTEEIGRGNLDYKIDILRNDELGDLARSFNQMATDLNLTTMALQKERNTLGIRVQERTAQLEMANRELDTFAYSVSHDLRAPLRGIDGWSLALLEDYKDKLDEQGHKYLDTVRSEVQKMGLLIDDLLMFSRQSRKEMKLQQIDMTAIAHAIASTLQQQNPSIQADFVIHPGLTAQGDASLIEITLNNLLGNALKFSSKNTDGHIEFGQVEQDGKKAFFVRDNGVGFDMAYVNKLFGVFQRLHSSAEFPGTGIGLATVQRIINRHGGRIWAEAQVNKGATFYFTLKEGV